MRKPIWSAFAMSLILLSGNLWSQSDGLDDFLGLEDDVLPEVASPAPEKKATSSFKQTVKVLNMPAQALPREKDALPMKGQDYSLIPWSKQDPEAWLSISNWIAQRTIKDQNPEWRKRLREDLHLEMGGKVLKCKGECPIFRGTFSAKGQYLSRVLEGDEIRTEKHSHAWIYLIDGTLLRLAPESSLSMQEVNISAGKIFYLLRLNKGHLYSHTRNADPMALDFSPETDLVTLPLSIHEANIEYFEREKFRKQNDSDHLSEVFELDDQSVKNQILKLNELKFANNSGLKVKTQIMVVAPNVSVVATGVSFDLLTHPGGKAYLKKRSTFEGEDFQVHLRGYTKTTPVPVTEEKWHEVSVTGRDLEVMSEPSAPLQIIELLTRRIKTLDLAREIWIRDFTIPLLATLSQPKNLAQDYGYKLWNDDSQKRHEFLVEYTRRIETTNLKALDNLLVKLENSGEIVNRELSNDHYQDALNHYLKGLKTRYTDKKLQVREMSDLQFYVWILKNGKL